MNRFRSATIKLIVFLFFVGITYLVLNNYSVIFARTVTGEVISLERLDVPVAMMGTNQGNIPKQVFSFSVGIEDRQTGEIVIASSEDRRWAAVVKGNCATARFERYPPWRLDKRGQYTNAHLIELMKTCDAKKTE